MIRIALLKKRSLFIILLASSTANPLLALPAKNHSIVKRNIKCSKLSQKIQDILVNKGLEKEAALRKTTKLFNSTKDFENKLQNIYNSPNLPISKEKINDALVQYALNEKNLDLGSYSGVLGLVQNASMKRLNTQELNDIKKITLSS